MTIAVDLGRKAAKQTKQNEKNQKICLTIEHSISLLRKHEDSQGQQLNQRIFSLTIQFAYSFCVALHAL